METKEQEKKENAFFKFGKSVKEKFYNFTKKPDQKKIESKLEAERNHFQQQILQSTSPEDPESCCEHESGGFLLVD